MQLVYLTTKSFPSTTADHVYVEKLAGAFARAIPGRFTLVVNRAGNLTGVGEVKKLSFGRLRAVRFFFAFSSLYHQYKTNEKVIWMSNDAYILATLCAYKFFFRELMVCSDWHVLRRSLLWRFIARRSYACVCVTKPLRDALMNTFGVNATKILVAPNGIELDKFVSSASAQEARAKASLPQDKIILGYFGRFKTMGMEKGIADVLRALQKLDDRFFFFAAGGHKKDMVTYAHMAQELGVGSRVLLRGDSSQQELALYQRACDMLLMPFPFIEHYAYFMSPMKMFEYMASGRPIITSDLPSVRDVLNEHNAFFVLPDDPNTLAAAIKQLADEPKSGEQRAAQALADVKHYTWDAKAQKIILFLETQL